MTVDAVLSEAMRRLTDGMGRAEELPKGARRNKATRSVLIKLHRDAMRVAAGADEAAPHELGDIAEAVRSLVPAGVENALSIRERVFVRLLRAGALEPAWTLAEDNSSGVVRTSHRGMRWAGGPQTSVLLALPTLIEGDKVYAWLPGFRDSRWGVPDDVYDITSRARLHVILQSLSLEGRELKLGGSAHFRTLVARGDDEVTVVLRGADGTEHRVPAQRARTPQHVGPSGPDLTRLAWAGWHADVDVTALPGAPRRWSVWVELAQASMRRDQPLGEHRGKYAKKVTECGPMEARGRVFRLDSDEKDGQLSLTVARLGPSARLVPRPLRGAVRQLAPRQ